MTEPEIAALVAQDLASLRQRFDAFIAEEAGDPRATVQFGLRERELAVEFMALEFRALLTRLHQAQMQNATEREVNLGVIEFHSERVNPGLIKRFYAVRDDLTAAGCIVDLWLMDIATVLGEFGYRLRVFTDKPLPVRAALPGADG